MKYFKCFCGMNVHIQNQSKKYSCKITEVQRGQASRCRYHSLQVVFNNYLYKPGYMCREIT